MFPSAAAERRNIVESLTKLRCARQFELLKQGTNLLAGLLQHPMFANFAASGRKFQSQFSGNLQNIHGLSTG